MTRRITRIEVVRRKRDRVLLHLEEGDPIEVALDVVAELEIREGDSLEPKTLRALEEQEGKWAVRQAALHLLSYRPRSESELRSRLLKKSHPPALIEWCIHDLKERGLLDDRTFAEAYARTRLKLKPRGRSRLIQELRSKGVDRATADQAVSQAFEDTGLDEPSLAIDTAIGWLNRQPAKVREGLNAPFGSTERDRSRRRLIGFLQRRGFPGAATGDAIEAACEEARRVSD